MLPAIAHVVFVDDLRFSFVLLLLQDIGKCMIFLVLRFVFSQAGILRVALEVEKWRLPGLRCGNFDAEGMHVRFCPAEGDLQDEVEF